MFLEQRITQDIDEIILLIDDYISKFEQFHSLIQEATDAHMLAMSVEGMNVSVWNILHVYDHMIGKLHDLDLSGSLHCKKEQETLWDETRRLVNPHKVYVDLSDKLFDMKKGLLSEYSR